MIWLLIAIASADPCPDPQVELQAANTAFDDAEVALAQTHVDAAITGLSCVQDPLTNTFLQDLYGFAAVVAYSDGDDASTQDALQVLHTIAVDAADHPYFGPELIEASAAAKARRPADTVSVRLDGGRRAWIDGQLVNDGDTVDVIPGSHVVQASDGSSWSTTWVGIESDSSLDVGEGIALAPMPQTVEPTVPSLSGTAPVETPRVTPPVEPDAPRARRRHRTGLLVTGALTAAAGGGALVYGWQAENTFHTNPYSAESYRGCAATEACYEEARIQTIQNDASRIRVAYLVGYGLTALGVGLVGTELFILPAPGASGGEFGVRGRF